MTHVRWRFCDVAHKHPCPLRMSPLENVLEISNYLLVVLESK